MANSSSLQPPGANVIIAACKMRVAAIGLNCPRAWLVRNSLIAQLFSRHVEVANHAPCSGKCGGDGIQFAFTVANKSILVFPDMSAYSRTEFCKLEDWPLFVQGDRAKIAPNKGWTMSVRPRFDKMVAEAKSHITEISAAQAAERQQVGGVLVDVREADEFAEQHAVGAMHITKGLLEYKIEERVPDPATPIFCYCGGGNRSALAVENLQGMGYENAQSVAGGFKAWQAAKLPTETGASS